MGHQGSHRFLADEFVRAVLSSAVGNVGDPDDPTGESWGGRWYQPFPRSFPNYYTDLDAPPDVYWEDMKKWRPDFLADWESRWEWYG